MTELTEDQHKSIDILQSDQDPDVTPEQRIAFMSRVLAVSSADLAATPQPAPVKRGRPSKHKGSSLLFPQSS